MAHGAGASGPRQLAAGLELPSERELEQQQQPARQGGDAPRGDPECARWRRTGHPPLCGRLLQQRRTGRVHTLSAGHARQLGGQRRLRAVRRERGAATAGARRRLRPAGRGLLRPVRPAHAHGGGRGRVRAERRQRGGPAGVRLQPGGGRHLRPEPAGALGRDVRPGAGLAQPRLLPERVLAAAQQPQLLRRRRRADPELRLPGDVGGARRGPRPRDGLRGAGRGAGGGRERARRPGGALHGRVARPAALPEPHAADHGAL
mmetsp:Transcript_15063/g.45146  ORF Transcript_15063/g.45146 Transcript_15063/m.45146 type:complete len:261 (-) Transcript_15063:110-892(-)